MEINKNSDLFNGLKALSRSSFPKHCKSCGREYATEKEYVEQTEDVFGQSGLKKSYDDDDKPIVELFRNCVCGSTLMDCFNDRRDISEGGLKRRELFGKLLDILVSKGLEAGKARLELLKILRGDESDILKKMGISTQIR